MENIISVNDTVNIFWEHVPCEFNATVLYIPIASGDSWKLKRANGSIFYVNSFCKMSKVC